MWQKCPVCNGEGVINGYNYSTSLFQQCSVCNGMKIISEVTGLPPSYVQDLNLTKSKEQLFREDLDTKIGGD